MAPPKSEHFRISRRHVLWGLPVFVLGLSTQVRLEEINKLLGKPSPIFPPGTCFAVSLLCGGYGAAIVLQNDPDKDDVRHLIGGLRGVYKELPTMEIFERRDWLHLTHGKFTGSRHLIWCESSTFEEDSKDFTFTVVGSTELRRNDPRAPNGVKGPGENSVYEVGISSWGWIENQIRLQHQHDTSK